MEKTFKVYFEAVVKETKPGKWEIDTKGDLQITGVYSVADTDTIVRETVKKFNEVLNENLKKAKNVPRIKNF
jgi:hypothetical protein